MYFLEAVTFPLICLELGEKVVDIKKNYFNTSVPAEGLVDLSVIKIMLFDEQNGSLWKQPTPCLKILDTGSTKLVFYNQLYFYFFYLQSTILSS